MVPIAFRRKVSPVTSEISLQFQSVAAIVRYVTWRTCSSAQSIPAYHIRMFSCVRSPRLVGALY